MKKLISIFLIVSLTISLSIPVMAIENEMSYDNLNYYMDDYYNDIYKNYKYLMNGGTWQYIKDETRTAYVNLCNELIDIDWAISLGSWVIGENLTEERYIEILVNLMTTMEYELNDAMNHQAEIDTLKTVADYTSDVTDIITGVVGFGTENQKKVDSKVKKQLNNLEEAIGWNRKVISLTVDTIKQLEYFEKIMQNYEMYHEFLGSISQYSEDNNLKKAADVLLNNVQNGLYYKLETFNKTSENLAAFVGKDVFLDTVVMEMLKDPQNLPDDETGQYCITLLGEAYSQLTSIYSMGKTTFQIGIFAGDMIVGTSSTYNRYSEMKALANIRGALVSSINKSDTMVKGVNDFATIETVCNKLRYILYVDGRGEYCLYNLLVKDGQLMSLININNFGEKKEWFNAVREVNSNRLIQIENVFPDLENYKKDADTLKKQNSERAESIPDNAVEYNGHFYFVVDRALSWKEAKSYCENMGGHIATVTDVNEHDFIVSLIKSGNKYFYWLGATDEEWEGEWKWVTGELWEYTNWASGQPDNHSDADDVGENYLTIDKNTYLWNDMQLNGDSNGKNRLENGGFICEYEPDADISENDVPANAVEYNGHHYMLFDKKDGANDWYSAKAYCESLGGHLATITSYAENNFLSNYMDLNYCKGAYLGASDERIEGSWEWVTNEGFKYSNWVKGEPNNEFGREDYLLFNRDGTWNDIPNEKWPFICEWEI